jgi:peptide/nickel transport system permease protein
MAPGKPGGGLETDSESANKQEGMAGHLIFKRQFHLDKPVFLNFRFWISDEEVIHLLDQKYDKTKKYSRAEKNVAIETIEDYGNDVLPNFHRILESSDDKDLKIRILSTFSSVAARTLIHRYGEKLNEEERFVNRETERENRRVAKFSYSSAMSKKEFDKLNFQVIDYLRSIEDRWNYSLLQKMYKCFFDTRFTYYFYNLLHFDFGISMVDKQPVLPKIMEKVGYSIFLSVGSIVLAYLLAVPIGIYSAVNPKTLLDKLITVSLFMLYSLPTFFVGTVLLFYFSDGSEYYKWFPTGGFKSLDSHNMTSLQQIKDIGIHMVLPLICLTYVSLASISRYARTGLLDVIHSDYIKTARAKGLGEWVVVFKHAVRNGLIPILTLLGSVLPAVVSGSVVIEVIFNIPGIGLESFNAVITRDYNMVMGIQLISAVLTLLGLLVSDILYSIVDPRIQYE